MRTSKIFEAGFSTCWKKSCSSFFKQQLEFISWQKQVFWSFVRCKNSLKYFFTKVLGQAFSSDKRFWTKKNSQIITFQSHWVFFADESQITATGSQKCHQRLKFFWDFLEKQFEEISTKPDVRRRRQQNDVFIDLSKATETKKMPKLNRKRPKQSKLFFQMFRKPIFLSGA